MSPAAVDLTPELLKELRIEVTGACNLRCRMCLRSRRPGEPACGRPWTSAYVTHRGEVQPCCMVMGSDRVSMGRLGESSFETTWGGEAYRAFRQGLLEGRAHDVCRGCSLCRGVF